MRGINKMKITDTKSFYADFINYAKKFGEVGELCFYTNGEPFIRAGFSEISYSVYLHDKKIVESFSNKLGGYAGETREKLKNTLRI
jgi:hypothetical protein